MAWIFEKIVEIVGQAISILISYLAISVSKLYALKGTETLNYFFSVFNGDPTGASTSSGAFGKVHNMFLYIGLAIIFFGMLYNLFKAFFGPLMQAESPTKTVLKAIAFAMLCGYSQAIVAFIFEITKIPYNAVASQLQSQTLGKQIVQSIGSPSNLLEQAPSAAMNVVMDVMGATLFSPSLWEAVVAIILLIMLFKNMLMLVLEMAERYLMIGVLTIIAPLCIACGAVKAVEDVFKNWLSWMINACIVLIFNTFFMCMFIFNFKCKADVPYLCMWIAWLKTGQKLDEHMNALGLKTAKTGGFGADVMGALITGLPMALGMADKVAGTNMAGIQQWARRGMQGPMPSFKNTDARKGEHSRNYAQKLAKGALNAAGNATGVKSLENFGTKVDNMAKTAEEKKSVMANKAMNTMKNLGNGTDVKAGSRRAFTEDQMNDMLSGKTALPAKGTKAYDETMKDMMDMKAGRSLTNELENKGYNITGMSQDQNGNVSFSAEDKDGNKIAGTLSEGEAGRNSGLIAMTGEDGQQRGLAITDSQVEGKENPLSLGGVGDQPADNVSVAAMAGSEAMEKSGETNGMTEGAEQVKVDGSTYALGEPDENGVRIGTNVNDPSDTKAFTENAGGGFTALDDGEKMASVQDTSTITAGGETMSIQSRDENGNITATDAAGNTRMFAPDQDGNLQELVSPDSVNTTKTASFEANGEKFSTTNEPAGEGTFVAQGENGQSQTFAKDKDGNIHATSTDANGNIQTGEKVADASGIARDEATSVNVNGTNYNLSAIGNGVYAGTDSSGNTVQFNKMSDGSFKMAQKSDAKIQESARVTDSQNGHYDAVSVGNGKYVATGADGEKSYFSKGADGSFSKTGETDSSGQYRSFRQASGSNVESLGTGAGDGVIVKSSSGDYVRTRDQQRYDQYGKPNANGNYMATTASDGSKSFFQVAQNENGTIPTYKISDSARQTMFEKTDGKGHSMYMPVDQYKNNQEGYKGASIDNQYTAAGTTPSTAASHVMKGGEVYQYNDASMQTANGQMLQQRYIATSDGEHRKLDMNRCEFDSHGYLKAGAPVYVEGNPNPIDFSSNGYAMRTGHNKNSSMPQQYVHATNTRNGQEAYIDTHGATECRVSNSYINGVPTNLDWGTATLRSGKSEGFSDSEMVATFADGTKARILPETARVDGLQGCYVNLPINVPGSNGASGQRVFMAAMPSARMESAVSNYFSNTGKNYADITSSVDITDRTSSAYRILANEFGIPSSSDVKNVKITPSANGPILQYSQNVDGKLRHYAVSASGFEGKSQAEAIYAPGGGESIVGYRQEIAQGEPFVSKVVRKNPMRRFHRENIFPEEGRRR